jgi:BASS family bile acid:Na+ symporter
MIVGVLMPQVGLIVEPYLLVWLGMLLFLNLIKMEVSDVITTFARPKSLAVLAIVKLLALPVGMYALTYALYKPLALPVLLISGMSTGLGAPFVVNIVGGRLPLVVGMIITTSLVVPFVLPSLTYALVGSEFDLPIANMILLLVAALFIPLFGGLAAKKKAPRVSAFAYKNSFYLSILFAILINISMFSKLSGLFFSDQVFLMQNIAATFLCFAAFALVGYAVSPKNEKSAGTIATSYVNNTLVMVFASQFFGPQVAALAGLYNIPYYACILIIKKITRHN